MDGETTRLRVRRPRPDSLRPDGPPLREIVLHPDGAVDAYYADEPTPSRYSTLLQFLGTHSLHAQDLEPVLRDER